MEIDTTLWLLTALAGFAAGLIDSIVGGKAGEGGQ